MKPVRCCFLAAGGRSPTPRQPYRACRGRAQHDRPPGVGLVRRLQAERIPHHSGTQYQHTATALRGLRATWGCIWHLLGVERHHDHRSSQINYPRAKKIRLSATLVTFILSTGVYEYVIGCSLGLYKPILKAVFVIPSLLFIYITAFFRGWNGWNVFMWFVLFIASLQLAMMGRQ